MSPGHSTGKLDVETFTDAVNQKGLLDHNLCLPSAVSRYEQVLADTLNQMTPIKSRLITIHTNAPWYNDLIAIEKSLRRKLERKWRRSKFECHRLDYIQQCGVVNQLLISSKEAYYSMFIKENSTDSRKLFKSVNKLLYTNLHACYPTAKSDTDLACVFADFFMQKIDCMRGEIAARRSDTQLTTISETVDCFSCERKLQSFIQAREAFWNYWNRSYLVLVLSFIFFFLVVHNLSASITLIQPNVTCLSAYHRALF